MSDEALRQELADTWAALLAMWHAFTPLRDLMLDIELTTEQLDALELADRVIGKNE